MLYKGKKLILDSFRTILSDYSIDVQDVVRSAILDDVDISSYIPSCKDNPYRLDQIRLCIKEGMPDEILRLYNGSAIYQIRTLKADGVDLTPVVKQLSRGNLQDTYLLYLLGWIKDGLNISKLNIAIIPQQLLPTFDYGLRCGFDMSKYNNGRSYSPQYISLLLQIEKNKKPVSSLLSGEWSLDILEVLGSFSKTSDSRWENLISNIDSKISKGRLEKLISLEKQGIDVSGVQRKLDGDYIFSDKCLDLILQAYSRRLNYKLLIEQATSEEDMQDMIDRMEVANRTRVGGRIRRY